MATFGEFKSDKAKEWSAALWDRFMDALDSRFGPVEEQLDVQKATADAIVRRGLAVIEELLAPRVTEAGELVGDISGIKTDAGAIKDAIQAILDAYEAEHLSADLVDETDGRQFLTTTTRGQITTQLTDAISAAIAAEVIARNSAVSSEATARNAAITAAINALKDGVDPAYDTLLEIAAKFAADDTALASLLTAVGNRLRVDVAQGLSDVAKKQARANAGIDDRNILINGDFRINQRSYASGVALAAFSYGHDRWRSNSGGCTYTFSQLASSTPIAITAGSLVQVIEDKNIEGGSYTLSWEGTAGARVAVNANALSGAFVASPITVTGQAAGVVLSVEFAGGTLGRAKLERGAVATPFVMSDFASELKKCQRYFYSGRPCAIGVGFNTSVVAQMAADHPVPMRAVPTLVMTSTLAVNVGGSGFSGGVALSNITSNGTNKDRIGFDANTGGGIVGGAIIQLASTQGNLNVDAEL